MLTEEVRHFVAGRCGGERASEMALDRRSHISGQEARSEKHRAARRMISDAQARLLGLPAKMQREESEREDLDRGDRAGEGRKRKVEPQSRENDEQVIKQRRPRAENEVGLGQISGEEIEQHGRKAGLEERVRIAAE